MVCLEFLESSSLSKSEVRSFDICVVLEFCRKAFLFNICSICVV